MYKCFCVKSPTTRVSPCDSSVSIFGVDCLTKPTHVSISGAPEFVDKISIGVDSVDA